MATDTEVAFAFLAYLLLPVAVLFLIWLVNFVRRRFLKKGVEGEAGGEGDA